MEKWKPDIETFYDEPIKVFCGACGRLMFLISGRGVLERLRETTTVCRFCFVPIDWGTEDSEE
jgi:hypothetical protein